jgi:HEAT repeat protein
MNWKTAVFVAAWLLVVVDTHAQPIQQDVRDFVRSDDFSRHSYRDWSSSYDSSIVRELAEMLSSKAESASWGHAALLLGAAGDERAVDALIAFLETPLENPVLSDSHVVAYESAVEALGYLVNRTGSVRALDYLVGGLTPSVWVKRGVLGVPEWETSYAEFGKRLSKYALFGLAVSGDPRAREALIALRDSPTPAQAEFRSKLDDILATWLEVHQQVAEKGIAGMYDDADAKRAALGFGVTR